ncbi:MAG: hypothetical protein U0T31_06185 [Chitinophagales bacterium]
MNTCFYRYLFLFLGIPTLFAQKTQIPASETALSPINRKAIFADRYTFIPTSEYEELVSKKNNFAKVDSSNAERLAMIETYIYLYEWEEQNKRPVSTLSKDELEKLMDKQLEQNLSKILKTVK